MYSIEINVFVLAILAFIVFAALAFVVHVLRANTKLATEHNKLTDALDLTLRYNDELYETVTSKRKVQQKLESRLAHAHHQVQKLTDTCEQQAQTILNMTNSHEMILDEIDSLLIGNAKRELGGTVIELVPGNGPTLADDPHPELIDPHMFQD